MANIDFSRIVTTEDKAALQQQMLLQDRKAECRMRIFAVCDEIAQINLAAAASAGLLDAAQMQTYRAGLTWIQAMRAACADGNWPETPPDVRELAALF